MHRMLHNDIDIALIFFIIYVLSCQNYPRLSVPSRLRRRFFSSYGIICQTPELTGIVQKQSKSLNLTSLIYS